MLASQQKVFDLVEMANESTHSTIHKNLKNDIKIIRTRYLELSLGFQKC